MRADHFVSQFERIVEEVEKRQLRMHFKKEELRESRDFALAMSSQFGEEIPMENAPGPGSFFFSPLFFSLFKTTIFNSKNHNFILKRVSFL